MFELITSVNTDIDTVTRTYVLLDLNLRNKGFFSGFFLFSELSILLIKFVKKKKRRLIINIIKKRFLYEENNATLNQFRKANVQSICNNDGPLCTATNYKNRIMIYLLSVY